MSAGQGSSISSYDITARSVPGIIFVAATVPLLPKNIILKILEVNVSTSTLITSTAIIFLFTLFIGEMIRTISEVVESTILSLFYSFSVRLGFDLALLIKYFKNLIELEKEMGSVGSYIIMVLKRIARKVSVAIQGYLGTFASPDRLFSLKTIGYLAESDTYLSQTNYLFNNRDQNYTVKLFTEKLRDEEIPLYKTKVKDNERPTTEKEIKSLYPIVRSKVSTKELSLSRRSEMFYVFSRSIYMVLGTFGIVYSLTFSNISIINYKPAIIFLISGKIGGIVGLSMLFSSYLFSISTNKHKKEYIENLMSEYYNS